MTGVARRGAAGRPGALVARAEWLDGAVDLLALHDPADGFLLERDGAGLVTRGVAAAVGVPPGAGQPHRAADEVARLLARIEVAGERPPLAVGALPFAGGTPARLVVPRLVVGREADGSSWWMTIGDANPPTPVGPGPAEEAAARVRAITAVPARADYERAVAAAVARIRAGGLEKVVLARSLLVTFNGPIDPLAILARLRAADPHAYLFSVDGLLGASPELLLARRGRVARTVPLAGSVPRAAGGIADAAAAHHLAASRKDRHEHEVVVRHAREAMARYCDELAVNGPFLHRTASVWHLATEVEGVVREPGPTALALAAGLHPTPAVCGTPTAAALATIAELELIDRGRYAGMIGWVDAGGDGDWVVALRCAELAGATARLFAGAGIVEESDPGREAEETATKFRTVLAALDLGDAAVS